MCPYITAKVFTSGAIGIIMDRGLGYQSMIHQNIANARQSLINARDENLSIEHSLASGWALMELYYAADAVTHHSEKEALKSLRIAEEQLSTIIEVEPITAPWD